MTNDKFKPQKFSEDLNNILKKNMAMAAFRLLTDHIPNYAIFRVDPGDRDDFGVFEWLETEDQIRARLERDITEAQTRLQAFDELKG